MSSEINWDALARRAEDAQDAPVETKKRGIALRDWLAKPVPLWAVVLAGLGSIVITLVAALVAIAIDFWPKHQQPKPAALAATETAPSRPTKTPTPTLTPVPTPTSLPHLVVWAPGGDCANVRAEPDAQANILTCLNNGTLVAWTSQAKENNGYTWYEVAWADSGDGQASSGWMAYSVVVWHFEPDTTTGDTAVPFYDANRVEITRWLPPHTPVGLDHQEGGWAWVQLPNGNWGWVKSKDLDLEQ